MLVCMELTDAPFNGPVIRHLRGQATPGHDPLWDLDGWELHVHPDLIERFALVSPAGVNLTPSYGLQVLVASGVAAGFVQGMHGMFLRLPAKPTEGARTDDLDGIFAAPDWYAIDPWQSDIPKEAGFRRLERLTETAYRFALTFT